MDSSFTPELDALPQEWRVDRFDRFFFVQQGKQVSKRNRVGNSQRPFLRTKNVLWGRLDLAELDEMHFTDEEESRLALQPGDLLICEGGDIGRTAISHGAVQQCYHQNHLHRARRRNCAEIDPEFVLFWLWYAFEIGNVYFGRGNVTTIPNLSQSKLCELPLPVPPLSEQRKIAAVLGLVQRAIEQQERLFALTTELKKALLHKLFTEGFRGEPQKQIEIGPVPESWEVVPLRALLRENLQNGAFVRKNKFGKGVLFANVVNMYGDTYVNFDCVDRVTVGVREIALYGLREGDLLVVRSSLKREGIGQSSVVGRLAEPGIFDCHLIRVAVDSLKILPELLSFYWRSDKGKLDLIQRSKTVTMTTVNQAGLSGALVPKPSLDEQKQIIDLALSTESKLQFHQRKRQCLTDLFQSLLQRLMTAQIRVDNLDLPEMSSLTIS